MFTCNVAFMLSLHTGHDCNNWDPVPQTLQRQRCLHGRSKTHDSRSPQLLHRLSRSLDSIAASPSLPWLLLPQHDSASSSTGEMRCACPPTWARTCSKLDRRELAVASLDWARSRQRWFSMNRLFTRSWRARFILLILWICSSFSFSFFITFSPIAAATSLSCCFCLSTSSNLIFFVCISHN